MRGQMALRTNQGHSPVQMFRSRTDGLHCLLLPVALAVCGTAECWGHHRNLGGTLQSTKESETTQCSQREVPLRLTFLLAFGVWPLRFPGEEKSNIIKAVFRMLSNPRVTGLERTFAVRAATHRGMLAAHCQEASFSRRPQSSALGISNRYWQIPRGDRFVEANTSCNSGCQTPNTNCLIQNMNSFVKERTQGSVWWAYLPSLTPSQKTPWTLKEAPSGRCKLATLPFRFPQDCHILSLPR